MRRRSVLVSLLIYHLVATPFALSNQESCPENMENVLKAVVVGATGATGRHVVKTLLERDWHVTVVSRRPFDLVDEKHLAQFTQIISKNLTEDASTLITNLQSHDALFNCLGTTRGQAGSAEAFVAVEVGLTQTISDIAYNAGIRHVSVVSAEGANKDMWVPTTLIHPLLYVRTLGEKEEAVLSHDFASVTVFRPGMLNRLTGDRVLENFVNALLPTVGLRVDSLALAMVLDAEDQIAANRANKSESNQAPTMPRVSYIIGNNDIRNKSRRTDEQS